MKTNDKHKILIVDDHPVVREGLALRINSQPDLEVCGEAVDVAGALQFLQKTMPDLVIIDISLRSSHGIDLIKQIKAKDENIKMLVSSMHDESLYAERSLRAGALGYINKREMPEMVVDAIRQVLSGRVYLNPEMTNRMLQRNVGQVSDPTRSSIESLSDRELEVFEAIGNGMTTRQVASILHLSVKTIETYREKLKAKLNLVTGAELSRCAVLWVLQR
jgi:DNA-binding NarL/FixJ family response regulator